MPPLPGTEPWQADGGRTGVLLCHGFTGSPASMRPWAEHLAAAGFTVRLPRLPGHGTSWHDMRLTRWPDWFATVERSLDDLTRQCDTVVVAGLSMGGTLALRLAQVHPDLVAGLILVNPSILSDRHSLRALPVLHHLLPSVRGLSNDVSVPETSEAGYDRTPLAALHSLTQLWALVRADLPQVTAPLLVLHSAVDHVVEPRNSAVVLDRVASVDKTEVVLHRSYHVATLDEDAPEIFERSVDFVQRVAEQRAAAVTA